MSRDDVYHRAGAALRAWSRLRPGKLIFRMSLPQFEEIVARGTRARENVAAADQVAREARAEREEADKEIRRALRHIINGVKGDPEEGEDGELLAAMGYVPYAVRVSLISAGRRGCARDAQHAAQDTAADRNAKDEALDAASTDDCCAYTMDDAESRS